MIISNGFNVDVHRDLILFRRPDNFVVDIENKFVLYFSDANNANIDRSAHDVKRTEEAAKWCTQLLFRKSKLKSKNCLNFYFFNDN